MKSDISLAVGDDIFLKMEFIILGSLKAVKKKEKENYMIKMEKSYIKEISLKI